MNQPAVPNLTILIVTWNGWRDTRRCLDSVFACAPPDAHVLVIDNASCDGTPENIQRYFPSVQVVRNVENVGHARGVNQGVALAIGPFVLLLDSDTELGMNSMSLMCEFLQRHKDVGLVAPRTYNSDGTVQESARRFPNPINGLFGRQSLLTRWFPRNPFSRRYLLSEGLSTREPYEVEQVSAACMLFRRSLFESVRPWDDGYFAYWVDSDWCFWLRQSGWRVFCVPQASVVHHEQNRVGRKKSWRRIWMFHYGAYRFYRKTQTAGMLDPRAILALFALSARGMFQLAQNAFLAEPQLMTPAEKTDAGRSRR
jgi:GT2 family glycosyltransferase